MSQRIALLLAGTLTAFVVALIGGLATVVLFKPAIAVLATSSAQAAEALPAPTQAPNVTVHLSADQAAQIALNAVANGTLTRTPELVSLQGVVAYEVLLNQGTVYVDANDGRVLFNNAAASSSGVDRNGRREWSHDREHNEGFEGEHDE
jgi:hypothetical protein